MSDQGPTNIPFNKRLQVIREELLPTVIESWNTLSDEAQKEISNMGNYFCKLHLLVNFAEEVGKGFKVYESITFDQFKPMCAFDSDAGYSVFTVVRATCKALLTGHGSDKSGAGGYFQSFMRGKELTMQLADTAHSRMNVVFVNAGSIFHHHEHIVKFLESFPNKNKLLSAVLNDIQEKVFLA
jgi:E1A/CREB-binding protein